MNRKQFKIEIEMPSKFQSQVMITDKQYIDKVPEVSYLICEMPHIVPYIIEIKKKLKGKTQNSYL